MAPFWPKKCELLMPGLLLVLLLGSLMGSLQRCEADPSSRYGYGLPLYGYGGDVPSSYDGQKVSSFSYGSGTGGAGGATVSCDSTGGAVSKYHKSGDSTASCFAYATGSSPPPPARTEKSGVASSSPATLSSSAGLLSFLISVCVLVFVLISVPF